MASRGGQRAAGTDGTDYMHRETIANHYSISALNKSRIKVTVIFHWLLFILMVARMSADFCKFAQLEVPPILDQLALPTARLWELCWLPSIMASMFAHLSLKKNNSSLLWQALIGNVVLGLGPVLLGFCEQYPLISESFTEGAKATGSTNVVFQIATCCWLMVCFQVHLLQAYFIQQLLSAWSSVKRKKTK